MTTAVTQRWRWCSRPLGEIYLFVQHVQHGVTLTSDAASHKRQAYLEDILHMELVAVSFVESVWTVSHAALRCVRWFAQERRRIGDEQDCAARGRFCKEFK